MNKNFPVLKLELEASSPVLTATTGHNRVTLLGGGVASTRGSCQNKRLNTEHSVQQAARCPVWDSHLFLSPGQNDSGSSLHVGSDLIFTISTCFGGRVGPGEGGGGL